MSTFRNFINNVFRFDVMMPVGIFSLIFIVFGFLFYSIIETEKHGCEHVKAFSKYEVKEDRYGCYINKDGKWQIIKNPAQYLDP